MTDIRAPLAAGRLLSLDAVRGVAVLGILLLNIVGFAMPQAAYLNPRAYGGAEGLDLAVYLVNFILFDGKMRALFSMLFGASMLVVIERAEASGQSGSSVHFRRMGWLLLFGFAHLILIWNGDILAHYALIGAFAYLCRDMPLPRLMALGIVLVLVELVVMGAMPLTVAAAQGAELDRLQAVLGTPSPAGIARDLALYRGSYWQILAHRIAVDSALPLQILVSHGCETLAYMLFGMAALRGGLFTGGWSRGQLRRWAAIGLGVGIVWYGALAAYLVAQDFSMEAVALAVLTLSVPIRPLMMLGWACLILLLIRPGGRLTFRVAAAGRMAFTNYMATSVICTCLFYGYGFGWYGSFSRAGLYIVVAALWLAMLWWSKPWLMRNRYGPLEWLWRSLVRWKAQPMRINASASH